MIEDPHLPSRVAILVIGYGSTLRSDDGVGQHVAHEVAALGWPGVRSIAITQLMPELAAEVAQAERVIFVDAVAADAGQGVQALDITIPALAPDSTATQAMPPGAMTHHATPQSVLALAQSLYGHSPAALLVSVPAVNFELGESLSKEALQGADVALHLIGLAVVDQLKAATRA